MVQRVLLGLIVSFVLAAGVPGQSVAATLGVAVDGINSNNTVGTTVNLLSLGGISIKYFIPLAPAGVPFDPCTYGAIGPSGCGTFADFGSGGQKMDMFLLFDPVSTAQASILTIKFEDLDLAGANDPVGFVERMDLYDSNGLIASFDDIGDTYASGNGVLQMVQVPLGTLTSSPFWAQLRFSAKSDFWGRNTAEYLRATIAPVPLPAALPLFGAGLTLMGFAGWRRSRTG